MFSYTVRSTCLLYMYIGCRRRRATWDPGCWEASRPAHLASEGGCLGKDRACRVWNLHIPYDANVALKASENRWLLNPWLTHSQPATFASVLPSVVVP